MFELNEQYIELFENYLNGNLSQSEILSFEQQLAENSDFANLFESFKIIHSGIIENSRYELKTEIKALQNKYNLTNHQSFFKKWYNIAWISASFIILSIGTVYFLNNQTVEEQSIQESQSGKNSFSKTDSESGVFENSTENNTISTENKLGKPDKTLNNQAEPVIDKNLATNSGKNNLPTEVDNTNNPVSPSGKKSGEKPLALFSSNIKSGCNPLEVRFFDSSKITNGNIVRYLWDFGDGNTSVQKNPVHKYQKSGKFSVKLTISTDNGLSDEIISENLINVTATPKADFSVEKETISLSKAKMFFANKSQNINKNTKYSWTFGDKIGKSNLKEPVYSYQDTGLYKIYLMVTNENGCTANTSKTIKVVTDVEVFIPTAFSPNEQGPSDNNIYRVVVSGFKSFNIQIFNRSGDLLYKSDDYNNHGWNGKTFVNEQDMPSGVYVVTVNIIGIDGQKYNFNKTVTLLR